MKQFAILAGLVLSASAVAVETKQFDGGPITTDLGYSIVLNKGSGLHRTWFVINDPQLPLQFDGQTGIRTVFVSERSSGEYRYTADYKVTSSEAVVAYEVRYVVFNVFGERLKTLSATNIKDIDEQGSSSEQSKWRVWSENEAAEYYASVAYIANVRTKSGKVFQANTAAVLAEVQKISSKVTKEQLEPDKPQK